MSSDDEDTRSQQGKQYLISQKPWRSPIVTQFFRTLDAIGRLLRVEMRGQPMRWRIDDPTRESQSPAVASLPSNAYLDNWLDQLEEWERIRHDIREDEEYDFSFPEWVERYALPTARTHVQRGLIISIIDDYGPTMKIK